MKRLQRMGESSLYRGWRTGRSQVLVCSTPPSRDLLTDPVVCGLSYRRLMHASVAEALRIVASASETGLVGRIAALDVLRGGLSFGVADALSEVLGVDPAVSFLGTRRRGAEPVKPTYRRWQLADTDSLVVGDIIGTGSTLVSVLSAALTLAARQGHPLRSILVFTVGSKLGVTRLMDLVAGWGVAEPPRLTVVALEALFELPSPGSSTTIPQLPFDLLRAPGNSTPEYERHRLQTLNSLFERCVIYDGGVRAFSPAEHVRARAAWWAEVADRGVLLSELAMVTAGLAEYRSPYRQLPPASGDSTAAELHELGHRAWRFAKQLTVAEYLESPLMQRSVLVSAS